MTDPDDSAALASSMRGNPSVRFSTRMFDLEIIKKAAYGMSGRCVVDFKFEGDDVICTLRPLHADAAEVPSELADAFQTAVLDQDLRRIIGAESAPIRNAILAYAFSRTGLQEGG